MSKSSPFGVGSHGKFTCGVKEEGARLLVGARQLQGQGRGSAPDPARSFMVAGMDGYSPLCVWCRGSGLCRVPAPARSVPLAVLL